MSNLAAVGSDRNPRAFWQRDRLQWARKRYTKTSYLTFEQAGCLVCDAASLAILAGYDVTPESFAKAIDAVGAFSEGELKHPSRVTKAFPRLVWHGPGDLWVAGKETSKVDWENRPADLDVLAWALEQAPAPVKVDFYPGGAVQQHFVLAFAYFPAVDPEDIYDDLWVMDPWIGGFTSIMAYVNPDWAAWCKRAHRTLVQRALLGMRVWEVLSD